MEKIDILKEKCKEGHFERLISIPNKEVIDFVSKYVALCNPASVFVRTDSEEDAEYIRKKAIENGEEHKLKIEGHTVHFDGYFDQARDKKNTKFLVEKGMELGKGLNVIDRKEGLEEINSLLKNIMEGKELFVLFLCLGPVNSEFSLYAVQLTDSAYVAHSEDILYRPAYRVFLEKENIEFFKYVHSAGELDERKTSKNYDKRRIYIDFVENIVYSVNTQYAGNTIGLKKPSLRLAIRKADKEGWLAEHMFVMRVNGKEKRKSYFLGAFPSMCGKTSTCMVEGENIVGDDIAYLRKRNGKVYAVNVERGIFGIIKDVNKKDDPLIWEAITSPGEVIFTNVLISNGIPFWIGDGRELPEEGINFSGKWYKGKKDENGKEIPPSHPNARYTIPLRSLKNCDPVYEDPSGVEVSGIIYGGRDSDTWFPLFESFDWTHGVITIGACLESETTAATLGKEGVRTFNPMANLDFLSIPIGKYIKNHLDFQKGLKSVPKIFGVNYFLKDENGNYLNDKQDKRVWLKWMELRVHNEGKAIKTPIGFIPHYEDLKNLFREVLSKVYTEKDYEKQFTLRIPQNLSKIERMMEIYKKIEDTPGILFEVLEAQKERLIKTKEKFGDFVSPFDLIKNEG
ncbi:MAG: phosphoenolpyruvate carboxykinase (GTP) [Candidatus Omnitrophota bacterium]|nr:MAG: phosphoenolpyruvate carboxykinase (GTP) [Candidatus Omnitrophota bacterium]